MDKKQFYKQCAENIFKYGVFDTQSEGGDFSTSIFLRVGMPKQQLEEIIMSVDDAMKPIVRSLYDDVEVCLSKEQLNFLIGEIEKHEANCNKT